MILSRTDPYGLRGAVKPGHLPETPILPSTRDEPENVRRCASCDVPPERCRGKCRSDADQERARAGGDGRMRRRCDGWPPPDEISTRLPGSWRSVYPASAGR